MPRIQPGPRCLSSCSSGVPSLAPSAAQSLLPRPHRLSQGIRIDRDRIGRRDEPAVHQHGGRPPDSTSGETISTPGTPWYTLPRSTTSCT